MARNQELLDLLNLHFLHFLLHSIKDLYQTARDSCWKGAKTFSHSVCVWFFFLRAATKVHVALGRKGFPLDGLEEKKKALPDHKRGIPLFSLFQ